MPNAAALSIANAAIYGIARSLEAEWQDRPQRINEVRRTCVSKNPKPFLLGDACVLHARRLSHHYQ